MRTCPVCGEYIFFDFHTCPEKWLCRILEYDDEWEEIYSNQDSEGAVIKYCEKNFSRWEYPESMTVEVCRIEDENIEIYDVEVLPIPEFLPYLRNR